MNGRTKMVTWDIFMAISGVHRPDYEGGFIDQISGAEWKPVPHAILTQDEYCQRMEYRQPEEHESSPCHMFFQFYVANGRPAACKCINSCRIPVPRMRSNIASYALLLQIIARVTGLKAGDFIHTNR